MNGTLLMSKRERNRLRILELVKNKCITLKDASVRLSISYRQMKRIYKRFKESGSQGLLHKSRGKVCNRKICEEKRQAILSRYEERYMGFGPTLACEKLLLDGFEVSIETLRLWLLEAGLWKRRRRSRKHRSRRDRRSHFGELVQFDGSHHNWFGGLYGKSCLMNMVDDATGTTLSLMAHEETTEAAMRLLWAWIVKYGIPMSIYCDRKSLYLTDREPGLAEQLEGKEPKTAFGEACDKLGIQIITAYSPQAKGRVERNHGVYQDRFAKELGLLGVHTVEGANKVLSEGFIDHLNRKFSIQPLEPEDFHVPLCKGNDLRKIFCFEYTRTVSNDFTIRFNNRLFQIIKDNKIVPRPKTKVLLQEWLDGSIHIYYQKRELRIKEITQAYTNLKGLTA
jgi:transposase